MTETICAECGIDRTEIMSRGCAACHEWAESLNTDYMTWRENYDGDDERAGEVAEKEAEIESWGIDEDGDDTRVSRTLDTSEGC